MTQTCTLYAITHSLYSGRARAYLIKHGIPFRELSSGHESFRADVVPRGKLATVPTLVTAQGEVIRDGAAIIEHFEAAAGRPCRPPGPRHRHAARARIGKQVEEVLTRLAHGIFS